MHLQRLKLTNFKGLAPIDLAFPEPGEGQANLLAFFGPNGSGKSSLLEAINVGLQALIDTVMRAFTASDEIEPPRNAWASALASRIQSGKNEAILEMKVSYKGSSYIWKLTGNHGSAFQSQSDELQELDHLAQRMVQEIQSDLDQNLEIAFFNLPTLASYGNNRAVHDVRRVRERPKPRVAIFESWQNALDLQENDFRSFFAWFKEREDVENELLRDDANAKDSQLECVRRALAILMPGYDEVRIKRVPKQRMVLTKHGQQMEVDWLSDGEKCLFAMVGDLARRMAIANPGLLASGNQLGRFSEASGSQFALRGKGVVLIDELDLHLHPAWQRRICQALPLAFPHLQFITTTHAPHVLGEVPTGMAFELLPSPVGPQLNPEASETFGRDVAQVSQAMQSPSRNTTVQEKIDLVYAEINTRNLPKAQALHTELAEALGEDDLAVIRLGAILRRLALLSQ